MSGYDAIRQKIEAEKNLLAAQVRLKDPAFNATAGREAIQEPDAKVGKSKREQYNEITDPGEKQAFFIKHQEEIISQK